MGNSLASVALTLLRTMSYMNECSAIVLECQAQNREPTLEEWDKLKSLDDMQRARVEAALRS